MAVIAVVAAPFDASAVGASFAACGDDVAVVDALRVDPLSWVALADAVADAVGPRRAVAVGRSLGAGAATAFARRHVDRCAALVLFRPAMGFGVREDLVDLGRAVSRHGVSKVWREVLPGRELPVGPDAAVGALFSSLGRDALLDGPVDLAAIAQPTLIVAQAGDPLHPMDVATAYWRYIPTSRLVNEVPGDDELWDRPDELVAAVHRFLREVDADG